MNSNARSNFVSLDRRLKKYAILLLTLLSLINRASAYTPITNSQGNTPVWTSMPVPFWINQMGSPQIANSSEFAAVQAAFQTWQNVGTASISFQYMGATPVSTVGQDGLNVITFVDDTVPLGSDTVASTFSFFTIDGTGSLVIQEADIALSTAVSFSTSGDPGKYDLQSVLTHEIGHFLGLDHSALVSSVMTPYGRVGQLDQRTLTYDDIAGVTQLYPNSSAIASFGSISGTILAGPTPVFGAHVVALDANGTPLVSTISNPDGTYRIPLLPAGSYAVYAEPLDGPVTEQNIGGTPSSFYYKLGTLFSTTYTGNVPDLSRALPIQVFAGQSSTGVTIGVLPATTLNIAHPAAFAIRIPAGSQTTFSLAGSGLTSGDTFSTSTTGVTLGSPTYGGSITPDSPTSAQLSVSIAANAAPGPKNISVSRSNSSSVLSGGFVITNAPPANIGVSPSAGSADGGTGVSISGQNFRTGAQVYIGGLAASNVQVVNSGLIQAVTPANTPGATNVVVVNTDGTWGVQTSAFTYNGQPPSITSVSPLGGSPGAVITILGTEFSNHLPNLDVRFNGTSAGIISASSTRIDAIVPYGATTGPITVSVLGQKATGPSFTVSPAPASTNLGSSGQTFIDASAANGGTPLTFGNTDDAAAVVSLPFTFTLFNKSYPSGSKISVTTNGWISLDAVTDPEYQHGPLPGTAVQRPDGTTGSIPSALIAPFFEDLFIKSNGSVTDQTLGASPNRQFIVEWSNAGILDEQGNDAGATLTFEAILYEGSNDIQFIYGSVSGPRSDGSSATIGIQDSTRTEAVQSGYNQSIVSNGFSITYHFVNGSYVPPGTVEPSTDQTYSIANRGGVSFITSGSAPDTTAGYATIQPGVGTATPSGIAIFGYRQNNVLVTEAGVPASPLLQGGRIYAEVSGAVNTGLAIANPNNQTATISFFFTDSNGTDFGSGTLTVSPNGQIARFLSQAPFNGGSNIHGTFTFSSNVPVAVIALRGLSNERNEFLISTLPVLDTSAAAATGPVTLPQFADGGGWTTQIILVNPGDSAASGSIRFADASGRSVTLTANGQSLNTFPFSVPKRSFFKLLTAGSGASVQSGSVQISPNSGGATAVPVAIFSVKSGGITVSEAAVPPVSGSAFRMYVEGSGTPGSAGAIQSGLAITNLSSNPAGVTFDLTALDGTPLANGSMTLPANGQAAKFLNEILPAVSQPVKGILRITTSGSSIAAVGLRGRYNERGDFLITTTPPAAESAASSTSMLLFPHIVDGGGYTTQFILFNETTAGSMNGDVRFIGQDANPLGLNLSVN
jgi:Matrixin/IPT/TIG domain